MLTPLPNTKPFLQCPQSSDIECTTLSISLHQLAESLGMAVDAKDPCTCEHSEEVAVISQILALRMGYSPRKAETIHIAGHLHDIGKIGIPDDILRKPGTLTTREWGIIKRHPEIGAQIVRPVKALGHPGGIADIILHHHESYDGTGYPHGLRGRNIPDGARIIAVADSLSAMLQPRTYKPAMDFEAAAADIVRYSGQRYDPRVVEAFTQCDSEINAWITGMHNSSIQE
ncbi:HD-GYP domain-containing protein [Desulfovibrio ferrophilus]|uniref:Metal dependent phosphohydrolase n=1 Tax=Desulfovibrio ferrophilus TaxID=241368 RepID=A0A2Z6B3M8_9BACT|nr:HD-GYP domain-containing protein [Desulfovibrio ferrophilus]BBD10010.1 metal dependent phosphohydrolase [Desulfovibrio ferrophilus]